MRPKITLLIIIVATLCCCTKKASIGENEIAKEYQRISIFLPEKLEPDDITPLLDTVKYVKLQLTDESSKSFFHSTSKKDLAKITSFWFIGRKVTSLYQNLYMTRYADNCLMHLAVKEVIPQDNFVLLLTFEWRKKAI